MNITLPDLVKVVGWGYERDKEEKATLKSELMLDASGSKVISCAIPASSPGHKFHSAAFIAGSFTVLVESSLTMLDFDMEAGEDVVGMDILCNLFGDHVVLDISPSVGGLAGTRIVRVKVKCGLKFEKQARSLYNSLVSETSGKDKTMGCSVGDVKYELKFFSEEAARALLEGAHVPGGDIRRLHTWRS